MNKLRLALLLLILLLTLGCCPKYTTTNTQTKDSTSYIQVVKIDTLKINADTIYKSLFIDCDSFIPINKFYRSGRANLKVTLDNKGKLSLTATCDSLEKLIISKTTEIRSLKKELSEKSTIKTKRNLPLIVHLFIYFILIILILILLKLIFKKYII